MMKRDSGKTARTRHAEAVNEIGVGKFTFHNGDVYDGAYKLNYDRYILVKDGNVSRSVVQF